MWSHTFHMDNELISGHRKWGEVIYIAIVTALGTTYRPYLFYIPKIEK